MLFVASSFGPEAAAKHLTPTTLELGGKSPTIVDNTVDIQVTAKRYTWAATINCGQTCIRPDYCMVHASIADEFISECKKSLTDILFVALKNLSYFL